MVGHQLIAEDTTGVPLQPFGKNAFEGVVVSVLLENIISDETKVSGVFVWQFPTKQRCQESLFGSFRTLGRPRGRSVDSRSRRRAVDSTHVSLPKGLPRLTLQRTASTSFSLSGSFTRLTQFGSLGSGHADNNLGSGSGWVAQRYNDPHRQSSARSTKSARTAFRSTYRATTKKCSSSWMGKLLNRPWYKCPCPEVP